MYTSNVFTSFDLMLAYLQLAMAEDITKKTTFMAESSGLYEFTMPFGLSNAGWSFGRLMEQCLGYQQFVILLLYLDDICIFRPDQVGVQLAIRISSEDKIQEKCFPGQHDFWVTTCQLMIYQQSQKGGKVKDWPAPKNAK